MADDDSAGHSICEDPSIIAGHWRERGRLRVKADYRLLMRGRIMTFMAGAEAERVILGNCEADDGDDRYQIDMMAEANDCDFNGTRWALREPRMRAMTRMLVRRHRVTIQRLASVLQARGTLSGDEIDALARAD